MTATHATTPPALSTSTPRRLRGVVRRIHFVLATVAGLLLSVVTISGALVVFRTELDWLYANTTDISLVRAVELDATAQALAERYPQARVQRLVTPAFTGVGDEWVLRDEKGTKEFSDDEVWKAFTDPGTGRLLGDTRDASGSAFLSWMAMFHHNLWLGSTGGVLIGTSGFCLLGFLITGVWLWWPGMKKLGNGFRLRWAKAGFVRNFDLHSWFGLLGLPIFFVLAITGAMFEFRWMRAAVHYGLGGSEADRPLALRFQPQRPPDTTAVVKPENSSAADPQSPIGGERSPRLTISSAIAAAEAAIPGTKALSVMPPRAGRADATWSVLLDYPFNVGSFSGALVQLNQDGTPKLLLDPRTMSVGGWVNGQLWGLHTGSWGGAWSKTLYLIVGLLPPALLVTGLLLWWHRRRQHTLVTARRLGVQAEAPRPPGP
jgi:uncharacterized iron-regulated membrane protein